MSQTPKTTKQCILPILCCIRSSSCLLVKAHLPCWSSSQLVKLFSEYSSLQSQLAHLPQLLLDLLSWLLHLFVLLTWVISLADPPREPWTSLTQNMLASRYILHLELWDPFLTQDCTYQTKGYIVSSIFQSHAHIPHLHLPSAVHSDAHHPWWDVQSGCWCDSWPAGYPCGGDIANRKASGKTWSGMEKDKSMESRDNQIVWHRMYISNISTWFIETYSVSTKSEHIICSIGVCFFRPLIPWELVWQATFS